MLQQASKAASPTTALVQANLPIGNRPGGCCGAHRGAHRGARRQRRLLRVLEADSAKKYQAAAVKISLAQEAFWPEVQKYRSPMAGIIAVSVAIGAEKLGRKISEKRLERKDRKAAEQRELLYGPVESSSSCSAAQTKLSHQLQRQERKREEARGEGERRRSKSSERTLLPEQPPPRYEDVVPNDQRRAPPYA
ncbi:hypothetical protein BDU57DRAFT_527500 [Ampelomyces quisqualis]|uniref:Uncharacterized protein n=1 Tax=Ampelomyces quisqualis TaxID=50730 RepID=A0A6A5QX23_AMPQU|nr:hypothetical protein BDU57DRAFT_527500 [Ampelomyces quisqualis]